MDLEVLCVADVMGIYNCLFFNQINNGSIHQVVAVFTWAKIIFNIRLYIYQVYLFVNNLFIQYIGIYIYTRI